MNFILPMALRPPGSWRTRTSSWPETTARQSTEAGSTLVALSLQSDSTS
jgi:hypothetical protein